MIFSLLCHVISFYFYFYFYFLSLSLSLSRPPPSFFSQPFSLLFLSISASLTIRQAAHLSSGTNAARLCRCHSKQLASAVICPISLRFDSPPPLASSSPHPLAKQLASPPTPTPLNSANATRQAICFTSTDVAEICPISLRSDSLICLDCLWLILGIGSGLRNWIGG